MSRLPELVVHVGLQQTGARMLWRALHRLRPQLYEHGVGLLGPTELARLGGAEGRLGPLGTDGGPRVRDEVFERALADLVVQERRVVSRARSEPRTIVVSSDHLLGRRNLDARDEDLFRPFASASIAEVVRAVAAERVRVVLYVRRQDRLMEASYLRALQNGGSHDLAAQFPRRFEPRFDHAELVERLAAIDGVDDLHVRPFEQVGSTAAGYVQDLLSSFAPTLRLDLRAVGTDLAPYRLYSDRAARLAVDVGPHLDAPKEARLVRDFLLEHFPGTDDHSTRVLPAEDRVRILEAYAPVNRAFLTRHLPDLPADSYDDDRATDRLVELAPRTEHAPASVRVRWPWRRPADAPIGPATAGAAAEASTRPAGTDHDGARDGGTDPRGGGPVDPLVDEITFPIDLVYTWVDGADPRWQTTKAHVQQELRSTPPTSDADDPSRYHDYGELRYSLRSVARFAPFVRHIFVVTDRQVPEWLDADHPDLTIVDHREIFADASQLPTFNSHAIESRLHHIDGLAEHYLYLNDDFFFGRPVHPDLFFHASGLAKFFLSHAAIPEVDPWSTDRSVDAAAQHTRELVSDRFGRNVRRKFKHAPYPQRRSVLFEMEDVLRDEFARTAASRLRSPTDVAVPSSLSHYYAYLTGRAVPGRITSKYVSLGEPRLARHLRQLRRRGGFDVLCVNDAVDAHVRGQGRRGRRLEAFMGSYWPTASPFER